MRTDEGNRQRRKPAPLTIAPADPEPATERMPGAEDTDPAPTLRCPPPPSRARHTTEENLLPPSGRRKLTSAQS